MDEETRKEIDNLNKRIDNLDKAMLEILRQVNRIANNQKVIIPNNPTPSPRPWHPLPIDPFRRRRIIGRAGR